MTSTQIRIPSHLREELFRRFEPWIVQAIDRYPALITLDPKEIPGLSGSSIPARLRDALISLHRYSWTLKIPCQRLESFPTIRGTLGVAEKDGLVYLGPKDLLRSLGSTSPTTSSQGLLLDAPAYSIHFPAVLNSIATLHHHRILRSATTITNFPPSPGVDLSLFDVSFELNSDNTATIL